MEYLMQDLCNLIIYGAEKDSKVNYGTLGQSTEPVLKNGSSLSLFRSRSQ